MYVSLFLGRLFPYALSMIEIQGNGFDCPERLFICLDRTFLSSTEEKSDIREIIPEFFTMPEIFLNLNELNFGKINLNNLNNSIDYLEEIKKENNGKTKIELQDVFMPNWCKKNPYLFVIKKKELLENKGIIDLNPWIDLMFGCTQRGIKAQNIGNLYCSYCYDGVINIRLKNDNILKNKENNDVIMRLFELGVNPTLVFIKRNTDKKKYIMQITDSNANDRTICLINGLKGKIRFIENNSNNFYNLFAYFNDHIFKKIILDEDAKGNYTIKNTSTVKEFNSIFNLYKPRKLIIKHLTKTNAIIMAGFYNGNILLINLNTMSSIDNLNILNKLNKEDQFLFQNYGKGIITSLEISKDENYIIYGNNKGTLVIIENNSYVNFENNEKNLKILKIISSHTGYTINSISINSNLNLFADCSYDNYIHIYNLPKCDKINSIFIKDSNYFIDYIFLSSQPLASIISYSNKSFEFRCYNINGHDLNVNQNDKDLSVELGDLNKNSMISPIMFTNSEFSDYLLYIFRNKYVVLRKMPLMDIVFINKFNEDDFITSVNISLCNEYIYVVDDKNEKLHIIKYKNSNKQVNPIISP